MRALRTRARQAERLGALDLLGVLGPPHAAADVGMTRARQSRLDRLTQRQALLVRELVRAKGGVVSVWELADATGDDASDPGCKFRMHSMVRAIRDKFGVEAIVTGPGVGGHGCGYRIGRMA